LLIADFKRSEPQVWKSETWHGRGTARLSGRWQTQRKDKLKISRKRKWRNNKNETTVDVVPSSIHIKMMGLDEVVDFGAEKKQRA
jgi:hypothetical protein